MAVIKKDGNIMNLPMSIERNNPIPLDSSAIWYSFVEMSTYAESSPRAYVGQILGLVDEQSNTATAYIITSTNGDLKEVGSAVVVDEHSIVLVNDKVSLYDFGKAYYKYIAATETEEARYEKVVVGATDPNSGETYAWKNGLEPKVVLDTTTGEAVLGWYEPNPTTMEGVSASLASMQNSIDSINSDIDNLEKKDKATDAALVDINATLATMYTKEETDDAIATAIADIDHLKRVVVDELPDESAADVNTIYMVPSGLTADDNKYYEYMLINGTFERVGSWEVNLSEYAKKEELDDKVDKVDGMVMVPATDAAKLTSVEAYAEPNFIKSVNNEFNVDELGKLTLVAVPVGIDLSQNNTIKTLQAGINSKVDAEPGKSLVSDTLIQKLEDLPTDAEKNYINAVSTEFEVDENRTLTILSVPASKISDLDKHSVITGLAGNITAVENDITAIRSELGAINISISDVNTSVNNVKTSVTNLTSKVEKNESDIVTLFDILSWKDLDEIVTE